MRRDADAVEFHGDRGFSGREVALFIEDLVVRQPLLAVIRDSMPVAEPGSAVEQHAARVLRIADQEVDSPCRVRKPRKAFLDAAAKAPVKQQVFGRVTRERELRRDEQSRALPPRLLDSPDDAIRIAGGIADGRVDLGERDAHRGAQRFFLRRRPEARAFFIAEPSSAGERTVATPASSSAAYLSAAVPLPPAITAPA